MNAGTRTEIEQRAAQWLAQRDGEAWSDADEAALQAWLAAEVAHRVAFLRLEAAWQQGERLQALGAGWKHSGPPPRGHWQAPPETRREQLLQALERTQAPPSGVRRSRMTRVLAVAAMLVCIVSAGLGWHAYTRVDSVSLSTRLGAIETQSLGDGSQATLASDSALDVHLSRRERRVELHRGEAIFDVAKDPGRPFVVDAGARQIVAVGTRFSVRRDAGEPGRGVLWTIRRALINMQQQQQRVPKLDYWIGLDTEQLKQRLPQIDQNTLVFVFGTMRTNNDNSLLGPEDTVSFVRQYTQAPIYSDVDSTLGSGV